uniref:Miraculin-like n=1 Tax=Nelumbo nucifera TaxID=4432 RepID=A0A822YA72_NELNU|nr:TPA_asm: hypothetical protein HUJ06_029484 [Nelumbo nucifera]
MGNRFLISGLLFLASILQREAIAGSSSRHEAVLDTDGNQLQAGVEYSSFRPSGERRNATSQSQIPTVKQHSHDMNVGAPLIFSPALILNSLEEFAGIRYLRETPLEERRIEEETDLNVEFLGIKRVWQVEAADRSSSSSHSQTRYVTLKGQPGNPGPSTVRNWFKIERISRSKPEYRIAYCPSVCNLCHVECGTVGITKESGNKWLSVSQHRVFPFVFVKARHSEEY